MKWLTVAAAALLIASLLLNMMATNLFDRAQPWLTLSMAMLFLVQPLLLLSLILWIVRRSRQKAEPTGS
jgi:hypothetical protein